MTPSSDLCAVLLDAGGTLIEERESRAELYAQGARAAGLEVDSARMRDLMAQAHAQLPQRVGAHFRYSRGWFEAFIERVFVGGQGLEPGKLPGVQAALFARFADPASYRARDGALELLVALRGRGLKLAVVSNWSPVLPGLLAGLGLAEPLDAILVSAVEACEKPDPELFRRALARLDSAPEQALHLGNDLANDVAGARAAGLEALLLGPPSQACASFRDLRAVRHALLERLR